MHICSTVSLKSWQFISTAIFGLLTSMLLSHFTWAHVYIDWKVVSVPMPSGRYNYINLMASQSQNIKRGDPKFPNGNTRMLGYDQCWDFEWDGTLYMVAIGVNIRRVVLPENTTYDALTK